MNLIDNVNTRLGDDLKTTLRKGSKLSIAASSFSIYAYEALSKELDKIDEYGLKSNVSLQLPVNSIPNSPSPPKTIPHRFDFVAVVVQVFVFLFFA